MSSGWGRLQQVLSSEVLEELFDQSGTRVGRLPRVSAVDDVDVDDGDIDDEEAGNEDEEHEEDKDGGWRDTGLRMYLSISLDERGEVADGGSAPLEVVSPLLCIQSRRASDGSRQLTSPMFVVELAESVLSVLPPSRSKGMPYCSRAAARPSLSRSSLEGRPLSVCRRCLAARDWSVSTGDEDPWLLGEVMVLLCRLPAGW